MPIGSISKSGNSFSGAAEYDLAQGKYAEQEISKKPEILDKNFLSATDYKELGKEFREVSNDNKNCKKPVLKFSISFDPKEKLTDAQKKEFTKSVMKEMGIREDNNQYMITRHSDKGHDHHHVLANRVGMDGKAISDSYSKNRLETAIDKTEKRMNLENSLAKTRRFVFDENSDKGYKVQKENFSRNREKVSSQDTKKGIEHKKDYIKSQLERTLQESRTISELREKLQKENITTEPRFNKEKKLTGISFNYENYSVKGSALGKEFKASSIEKGLGNKMHLSIEKAKQERKIFDSLSTQDKLQFMQEKKDRIFGNGETKDTPKEKKEAKSPQQDYSLFDKMKKQREAKQEKNQEKGKGFRR